MNFKKVINPDGSVDYSIHYKSEFSSGFLSEEERINATLNAVGLDMTQVALTSLDTQGEPLTISGKKYTKQGLQKKRYYTPYGWAEVHRHTYQTGFGGGLYVPMEERCHIFGDSTPRASKMVSWKYSQMSGRAVCSDMAANHQVALSTKHLQYIVTAVGAALREEELIGYDLPDIKPESVHSLGIGCDGAMVMCDGEWREAMVGTLALYDKDGGRLASSYMACSPETGKEVFYSLFSGEIERFVAAYPKAIPVGIADGSASNWTFLGQYTETQITDFYHATTYLAEAGQAMEPDAAKRAKWLDKACHRLKHNKNGAGTLLQEMRQYRKRQGAPMPLLDKVITYFTNQGKRMKYREAVDKGYPIGSGVTEAACKTLVKQRLCQAGMRWTRGSIDDILLMRGLVSSYDRWEQAWDRMTAN